MKRLTVSIDDLATLRYVLNDSDFDPVQYAILCEVAGANGISLTLSNTDYSIQERDALLLKKLYKTFLNVRIPPEPRLVKSVLSINPDMVTFVDIAKSDRVKLAPLSSSTISNSLSAYLADFRANSISVSVYAYPEINILKQLSRERVDYVEFDCTEITLAADSNEELVGLDKLNTATLAAAKLGMGSNCYGAITYENLPALARIQRLEDICMDAGLMKRAMLVGIDRAVNEAKDQIRFNQKS